MNAIFIKKTENTLRKTARHCPFRSEGGFAYHEYGGNNMFYIKTKQHSGKMVSTEITDENVFTRCPECGREMPVDLAEIFADGEGDLFSTQVLCAACTKVSTESRLASEETKITTDGITVLANVLRKAGYWRELSALFDLFEIEDMCELEPNQMRPFSDALTSLAVVGGLL
jgi:hypothetical protein